MDVFLWGRSAGNDGNAAPLYLGHPKFEGFEVKQTIGRKDKAA